MAERQDTQKGIAAPKRSAPKLGLAAPAPAAMASEALTAAADADPIPAPALTPEVLTPAPVTAPIPVVSEPAAEPIAAGPPPTAATFKPFGGAGALFSGVQDSTKSALEKSTSIASEITTFMRDNAEAYAASSRIAVSGVQTMREAAAEIGAASIARTTSAMKGMAAAKSPSEYYRLQSDFAKSSFEGAFAEMSKFNEAIVKLASDVAAPLSARASATVAKVTGAKPL